MNRYKKILNIEKVMSIKQIATEFKVIDKQCLVF